MKIILFEEGGTLIWGGYAYCFYPNFQGVRLFGGLRLLGTLEYLKGDTTQKILNKITKFINKTWVEWKSMHEILEWKAWNPPAR